MNGINPYKEVIKCRDSIIDIPIIIKNEDVELYTHISLPIAPFPEDNVRIFNFSNFIWKGENRILVNGVIVSDCNYSIIDHLIEHDIKCNSLINFVGSIRPVLSIDRNSIVSVPDSIKQKCDELAILLVDELVNQINKHIEANNIPFDSKEASLILNIIVNNFPSIAADVIQKLAETTSKEIVLPSLQNVSDHDTIESIINATELNLCSFDMREHLEITRELLLGKMLSAKEIKINGTDIKIISEAFSSISLLKKKYSFEDPLSLTSVVVRSDEWQGSYSEYDFVSNLWPVVSPTLFDKFSDDDIDILSEKRSKKISNSGNGLAGIAKLDPVLINPKFGISSQRDDHFQTKKCRVGECGYLQNEYWLFELNQHGDLVRNNKKDYVLFAFIAPKKLNDIEETRLSDFEISDPVYVKGVKEGWSILFIGHEQKYFILPGRVSRSEIIEQVPSSIKSNPQDDITYYNLDDSPVF